MRGTKIEDVLPPGRQIATVSDEVMKSSSRACVAGAGTAPECGKERWKWHVASRRSKFPLTGFWQSDVGDVMGLLSNCNVTSAPVVTEGKFGGFVDYLDLLSFMVQVATDKVLMHCEGPSRCFYYRLQLQRESRVTPPSQSIHTDDVSMIMERSNAFKLHSVRETHLKNKSHHDPAVTVGIQDPLTAATKVRPVSSFCVAQF
jgi:hypothetical protein